MRVRRSGAGLFTYGVTGDGAHRHRAGLARPVLLRGGAVLACLAVVVVAAMALVVPAARAADWPQYTDPSDTHETNSAWYPFTGSDGTAVGDSQIWVSNQQTELTAELNVGLGLANYGTTDVFYCDDSGQLLMRPWDFTVVPAAPTSAAAGSTLVVPAQADGVGYLGVCEVGGTAPDVFVFYVKGDPTVAANRTTLYWRQITESWQTEHSVAMPGDFLSGSTWDQVPSAGSTWFLHGKVVALQNAFAFVSLNASEVDTYVSNLLAPDASGAVDLMTSWEPTTLSGQQVRDVDAIPFSYQGSTYLALGSLYGTPTTNYDSHWGSIVKQWDAMNAAVRVCSVSDDGSCTAVSTTSFAVTACPDPGPHLDGSGLVSDDQSGALDIRLARGGVTSGPTDDVLTVMTRTFGTLDRCLVNDNTHGVTNHYRTIQPELLDAFEVSVDDSQSTPTLEDGPQRYSAWQRRGLMSDGNDDLEATKTVYQLINAEGLVQRNFFVTTLVVDDPNGPTNPSLVTPSPSPSASPLVYGSARQRIVWATATQLHAHGVDVKNLDDLNDYTGVVGAVGSLDSDALQPVKVDTTDQNDDTLATPIAYPYPIKADSSDLQLIGVIYGTPPTSLNNNLQSDVFPLSNEDVNNYSSVQFGQETVAGTTTKDTTQGSAGAGLSGGEGGHGLKFPFEPELSWTTDREDISSNALSIAINDSWWPGPNDTPTGYALFKQNSDFELQRFTRLDWDGGEIGNGVSESVFVTNPMPTSSNGLVVKTFPLTDPDQSDSMFQGMKSRPDTFSWSDWQTVDPLGDAEGHGELFAAGTEVTLSHNAGGGHAEAAFTQSSATQDDVVSNGVSAKLKIPFFTGDYSYTHQVDDVTTTSTTTEVTLGLPQPPAGKESGSLTYINVTAYWLKADDADAYWIPDAFRTSGNYQTPWCIDYRLTDYGAQAATAGEAPKCRVAVRCSPANGGSASVLDQERASGGALLGTAGSAGELIKADPAPGFRFTGWKLYGRKVARLDDAGARTTRVSATGHGGVTAVAQFTRLEPTRVRVVRDGADAWDVSISRAALPTSLAALRSSLDGSDTATARELTLRFGADACRVPATAWRHRTSGGHTVYTAAWRPSGWSRQARVLLTIDAQSRSWSLDVDRGPLNQAMLTVAGGGLPVALLSSGQASPPPHIPVACTATFAAARTRPAGVVAGASGEAHPVSLSKATISTAIDARRPSTTRFVLAGARVRPDLLDRAGFDLAINGSALHVGPFSRRGATYTATGRAPNGVRIVCRYATSGSLSLTLTGRALFSRLSKEFLFQNVTLAIGAGQEAPSDTMVLVPSSVAEVRLVPATGDLAR